MPRPKDPVLEERRRGEIVAVVLRLLSEGSLAQVTFDRVARQAGVSKGMVTYYFPSKDALHRAVLDRVLARWNESLPRILEAAAGEDRFDALLSEVIGFFVADPNRARLVLREALDRPDAMRQRLRVQVAPWIEVIAGYIRRGQERGDLRGDVDPEAYLLQIVHLIVGGVAIADTLAMRGDPSRLVREIERMARVSLFTDEALHEVQSRRERAAE